MQLGLSFSALLASFFVVMSASGVQALPVKRNAGMVTLPLKRLESRSDIHPQLLFQQHVNRGHRRLARMTGRQEPSEQELRERLRKRMYLLEHGPGSHKGPGKRYNRHGISHNDATSSGRVLKGDTSKQVAAADSSTSELNTTGSTGTTNPGVSPLAITALSADALTAAIAPTADNSLGLDIEANDVGYIATVQIGSPARDFKILMDSGSADFWVGAENCQTAVQQTAGAARDIERRQVGQSAAAAAGQDCGNHVFLGQQSSSSFVDTQSPFQVTYGSGEVSGTIVTDDVSFAGLTLKTQTFGTAQTETVQFTGAPFDGLMGLAQSTLSEQKTLTPVESLAKQGLINAAITSYKISRLADQKNDGQVTFGGLDATKFDPATLTTFANVNQNGFWEGDMPAVTVNGQDTGLQGRTAILDTGTTLIIAPAQDALAIHQAIKGAQSDGQGGFTVPCTTTDSVALTLGGTSFAIDPRDLAQSPIDPQDPTGTCISGISSGDIGGANQWLVGDVFLKNAYFSTDVTKNQISLAKLV